ncbi:MAG: tyrosine-type recombinase/integrase [Piscinibacter sp.]|uniref:tyrosine-type recombinase/integrase n=1 Tax=Piscinibacter sp. TaxID=1903157 RepID=UPI00258D9DBF|nr:integrase arm-type DNA-binding domain-containing protein [Piscinibacter sp.]MCW5664020.1 tyrosine-type recombinase/integrase [Piscinibacter sp.]
MPLTDPACKNARCPADRPRLRLADAQGLYLEVTPNGSKHWRWKYRFAGKEKRLALGSYPAVSLSQARLDRDAARLKLKAGTDPSAERRDERLTRKIRLGTTFEAVARSWHENWRGAKSPRHADYVLRRLEADVFPAIGAKPIAEVTAPQLLALAKKIESRGALDIARRAWQTAGQVFEHALAHGMIERNPARDVRPGAALKPRTKGEFARLEPKDMPELLRKMQAYPGSVFTRYALELMARTFVRTGELIAARWEEFDLDAAEWRIPAARMKMKTPHIVPLSTQAVDALRCLHELKGLSGLLFPGERDHEKPMSNGTILGALKRMGYAGAMTGHGFRGVASTILHEAGFDHAHIELQLAHQERNAVSAAYNHATYLQQRRRMMQWYSDHLDQLRQGAKVIPFKAA